MEVEAPFQLKVRLGQLAKSREIANRIELEHALMLARGYDQIIKTIVHDIMTRPWKP